MKTVDILVYSTVFVFTLIESVVVLFAPETVLEFFYGFVLLFIFYTTKKIYRFQRFPIPLAAIFFAIVITLIMHFNEMKSQINLWSIFIAIYCLSYISYMYQLEYDDNERIIKILKNSGKISLCGLFLLSIIFTAIKVHGAPSFFPWEALYTSNRLVLVDGDFGVTENFYICTLLLCLYSKDLVLNWGFWDFIKVILLMILIYFTKARTGFLVVICDSVYIFLAFVRLKYLFKPYVIVFLSTLFLFPFLSLDQTLVTSVNNKLNSVQETLGQNIRISDEYTKGGEVGDFSSGRIELNLALLKESFANPFFGSGDSDLLLRFGITDNGDIAYSGNAVSSVESPIRIAVKYGWIYFSILVFFLLSPLFVVLKKYKDIHSRNFLYLLVALFVGQFFETGGFEVFYGDYAISVMLLLIFSGFFKNSLKRAPAVLRPL